jgi:hypothetical protein
MDKAFLGSTRVHGERYCCRSRQSSVILLENNRRMSSSKCTCHINIQYFFVTDHVKQGNLRVAYCPTDDMIADFFTKPLQGTYRRFRELIMNSPDAAVAWEECVENVQAPVTQVTGSLPYLSQVIVTRVKQLHHGLK